MNNRSFGVTFKGIQVPAKYRTSEIGLYRHNAFIEALPRIWSTEETAVRMARRPTYRSSDRRLSPELRLQLVQTIKHYMEPLTIHLELERRFSRMIRDGYVSRNPISAEWKHQISSGFSGIQFDDDDGYSSDPVIRSNAAGFSIIGTSGVGKTTALESVLGLYPQVIVHSEYHQHAFSHKQLVWIKLDCPPDASIKGLCLNFFQAIDDVLDTRYYVKYGNSRRSIDELVPAMAGVAATLGLGVLVIDEIQRLSAAKSGGAEKMLNFFVHLVNTIGVPVVLVGTYQALGFMNGNFAQARRAAGQGDLIWSHMMRDDNWDLLVERLWAYQWTNVSTPLTEELKNTLYDESVGILDIAVKLYMLAQWDVIGSEDEQITPGLIHTVAKDSLKLARPILEALRSNDIQKLSSIQDVYPLVSSMDSYLRRAQERVGLEGTLNSIRNQQLGEGTKSDSVASEISHWLIEGGFEYEIANRAAQEAIAKHSSHTSLTQVRKDAFIIAEALVESHQKSVGSDQIQKKSDGKRGKAKSAKLPLGSLIEMFERAQKNKESMYDLLLESGILRDATEYLS